MTDILFAYAVGMTVAYTVMAYLYIRLERDFKDLKEESEDLADLVESFIEGESRKR